ncbi:MAG: hypothetical protein C4335_13140 [Armatimonadota bacterium]
MGSDQEQMPKHKNETIPQPSEETIRQLEPARGVTDPADPRLPRVANYLLTLPQAEQLSAAQWLGSQPEYAGVLSYLLSRLGVSGALRRVLKRAMFDLRRQGVEVTLPASPPEDHEAPEHSREWTVTEAYASLFYEWHDAQETIVYPLHLRFFMRHSSGERAVFVLGLSAEGYLDAARLVEEGVRELYQECVDNPLRHMVVSAPDRPPFVGKFVAVPIEWAVRVAHEARERNLRDHQRMPAHAAFYWGRLPEPPEPPVPMPVDSIPKEETGWMVSPLVTPDGAREVPLNVFLLLMYYAPPPELFAAYVKEAAETESRLVIPSQAQEEYHQRLTQKVLQGLFPNEELREMLARMLPLLGSVILLGGDRESAVWCKALWRELTERTNRPFWQTETARLLAAISYQGLQAQIRMFEEETNIDISSLSR